MPQKKEAPQIPIALTEKEREALALFRRLSKPKQSLVIASAKK